MTKLTLKYLSIILSIYIVSMLIHTVDVGNILSLLVMGLVLLLINLVLKPILLLIALPFNILTLGLFSFVVNALTIMLAAGLVPGISMGGFLNSLLASLIIVILNNLLIDAYRPSGRRGHD
ncbi:MAG: phage holin family protein [Oscillospiraceae bacterium]|nr:phage holin family protein [Oscillospiraceae bacterium]